jgi:hypothetical protein
MQHTPGAGIAAVAIAFWIFIAVVSVAGMIQDYRKRQLALEPLRIAIEHGQQLSPEIIAKLLGRDEKHEELDPNLPEGKSHAREGTPRRCHCFADSEYGRLVGLVPHWVLGFDCMTKCSSPPAMISS